MQKMTENNMNLLLESIQTSCGEGRLDCLRKLRSLVTQTDLEISQNGKFIKKTFKSGHELLYCLTWNSLGFFGNLKLTEISETPYDIIKTPSKVIYI